MRILKLAPHSFFLERGTPIDVLLVLKVVTQRNNTKVDIVVYNEGRDVKLSNLNIHRIPKFLPFTRNVKPGFSYKKIVCDVLMFFKAWSLIRRNKYNLIHAGEESVFMAMFFKYFYNIPYVYDLDSSLAQQLVENKKYLKLFSSFFNYMERIAIQNSVANLPVCYALGELCERSGSNKTAIIHDISQLKNFGNDTTGWLKKELKINKTLLLYIGNLESYQGIDLLLESFSIAYKKNDCIELVIIGGDDDDIQTYRDKAEKLNIKDKTHFLGPKPFDKIDEYLGEADILVCPRIQGVNTPMKIFPYLHSGKPVLATDIYTHNQILTSNEAYLAPADPEDFAKGMIELHTNKALREELGKNGKIFVEKNHTFDAHQKRLNEVYDWIEKEISTINTAQRYKLKLTL